MDLAQFKNTLGETNPPSLSVYLQALWHDAKGAWDKAHQLIQDLPDKNASWIHAYLHRKEGDVWNADYWYTKAGKKRPATSLQEEWESIAEAFLQ
jgi:hypothetical protein